jgi:hypothetical protein
MFWKARKQTGQLEVSVDSLLIQMIFPRSSSPSFFSGASPQNLKATSTSTPNTLQATEFFHSAAEVIFLLNEKDGVSGTP